MSGILFYKTKDKNKVKEFYRSQVGMEVWLEQKDCVILRHGNLLVGFCTRGEIDTCGMLTFFYPTKGDVDTMYEKMKSRADDRPKANEKYNIYHFFAKDPEDRTIEFQTFLHPVGSYLTGDELLVSRRSVRVFEDKKIPDDILWSLFEVCRYAPTSRNSQSYYFLGISERETVDYLASVRKGSSEPIGRAPMAIVVCSDPSLSKRHIQDGCIAAYHFTLAAWNYGLGTCWIGGMDREEVKERLGIPQEHYIATVTPLGYPAEQPTLRERKPAKEYVKFLK